MAIDFLPIKELCSFNCTYDWCKNAQNCTFWHTIHRKFSVVGAATPFAVIVVIQCEIVLLKNRIMIMPLGN